MAKLIETKTDRQITVNAFNPGAMSDTNFMRVEGSPLLQGILRVFSRIMNHIVGKPSSAKKSGAVLASLVTETKYETMSGKYLDRGVVVNSSPLSYNIDNANELWKTSMDLSSLQMDETIFGHEN
jgi:hypothetical protein